MVVQGFILKKQLAVAEDYAKEIIEIVGDAAGQPADGFHPFCLGELFLESLRAVLLLVTLLLRQFTTRNFGLQSLVGLLKLSSAVAHAKFKSLLASASSFRACRCKVISRMALKTRMPSLLLKGLRLISTGNSVPSLWRPKSSMPEPIMRKRGALAYCSRCPRWFPRKRSGMRFSTVLPSSSSRL